MNRVIRTVAVASLIACISSGGCTRDPNVRKQKYLENGRRYFAEEKYPEAAIQFANAVKLDPMFAEAHYELAKSFLKLRDGNGAYAELLRTVDLQPENMKAQVDLANVLFAAHEYKQAIERADLVLKKEPNNAEALVVKGIALGAQGDQPAALALLKQAVTLAPDQAILYSNLGAAQAAAKDLAGAEQSFRKAVELDPKSSIAVLSLARFYEQQRRGSEAEAQFQKAVQLEPKSAEIRRQLAKFYFNNGQMDAAEKVVSQAKSDLPNDQEAYGMLGDFYRESGQTDKATAEYAQVLKVHKDDVYVRKNYVQLLVLTNRLDEAENLNKEILKKNAKDTEALSYNAQILLRRGRPADAIPILESVIKSEPDNVLAHNYLGQALAATGNTDRAVVQWAEAVRLRPTFADANRRLAEYAISKNDAAGVRRAGEALISSQPKSALGYLYLATADVLQQNPKAADVHFAKALEIEPDNPVVNNKVALWRMKQGLLPAAEKLFEHALALDPNNTDAMSGLVKLYRLKKQPDAAIARVQAQIAKAPQNSLYHQLLGELLIGQKNLPGAEAELKKAVELPNSSPDAVLVLAHVQAGLGKADEAIRGYQRFSDMAPKDARGYFFQALLEQARGNFAQAEELYGKALAIDSEHPQAASKLASLLLRHGGNTDVALSLAQTARQRAPDAPDIADTLAWAYYHKGVYDSARKLLAEAISKDPNNPTYHFHLGRCYASMNDKSKARAELQRALQLDPKFPEAEEARKAMAQLN